MTKRFSIAVVTMAMLAAGLFVATNVSPARGACAESVSRIAYAQRFECISTVWVMNADGTGATQVSIPYDSVEGTSWSPDQSTLAFGAQSDLGFHINLLDVASGGITQLTDDSSYNSYPSYSPDGSRMLFVSDRSGAKELWVMNVDGSTPTKLTSFNSTVFSASYSPDASKIVFSSVKDADFEIYVMDADGSNVHRLTTHTGIDYEPAWSPDGTRIVWAREDEPSMNIWTMNADGTSPTQVEFARCLQSHAPVWSPDGSRILYSYTDFVTSSLRSVSVTDATDELTLLTVDPVELLATSWSPAQAEPTTTTTESPAVPAFTC